MTLRQIQEALQSRRLSVVAADTGVHENTLRTIRDSRNSNPTHKVLNALSEYLSGEPAHG